MFGGILPLYYNRVLKTEQQAREDRMVWWPVLDIIKLINYSCTDDPVRLLQFGQVHGSWYPMNIRIKTHPMLRPRQTRTHCCGYIVADTNVSPFARSRNICCAHKFCVRDTKMFLILFRNILCPQQMFPSLRSPRNIMGNNVSSFTRALRLL